MKINVKENTIVKPSKETPKHTLRSSNLDLLVPSIYVQTIYFYKPNGSKKFFDTHLLKEALSNCLVVFYPVAGRLRRRDGGSKSSGFDVDCNGEGVLFVAADYDGAIDDFGDFSPCLELQQLIPTIGHFDESFSSPLLLLQVYFSLKCFFSTTVIFFFQWFLSSRGVKWIGLGWVLRNQVAATQRVHCNMQHIENGAIL